jgi:hypothetical protein
MASTSDNLDDMTMLEREQWLINRGIQIEKSGET